MIHAVEQHLGILDQGLQGFHCLLYSSLCQGLYILQVFVVLKHVNWYIVKW